MNWKKEIVVLDCGTGSGKSYFCIHILGDYAKQNKKKILYLCNRKALKQQVINDVEDLRLSGTIYVMTYQALQKVLQQGEEMPSYDYIVADECHYFTTDAIFNDYTDISYNYVMKQKEAVVLLISATAKSFFNYLISTKKVKRRNYYILDKDYSYVNKLYYYQSKELKSIIDDILENEPESKIVVFCNNGSRIIEMNTAYREAASYYCSKSTSDTRVKTICGWKDNEENNCITRYPDGRVTFDKRILFTTSVLDNGVDLKDRCIKHVFSEIVDVDTMIQSLGRKRELDENDTCTFYIREYQSKGIQWFINKIQRQLEPVKLYNSDYFKFCEKYKDGNNRDEIKQNDIFYNSFNKSKKGFARIRLNECKYRKYMQDFEMYSSMKELGHICYLEFLLPKQLVEKSEQIVVNVEQIDSFLVFLKSVEGKWLFDDDRKFIKQEFETIGLKLRYVGINTFNGALSDLYESYTWSCVKI